MPSSHEGTKKNGYNPHHNSALPLSLGTRLGAYEVVAAIGAGGMGEVYRARDTRLKRDVAVKVLPEAFSQDPERLARFQREAEVLATLNHLDTPIGDTCPPIKVILNWRPTVRP